MPPYTYSKSTYQIHLGWAVITPERYIPFSLVGSTEQTQFRNLMSLLLSRLAAKVNDSPNKFSNP